MEKFLKFLFKSRIVIFSILSILLFFSFSGFAFAEEKSLDQISTDLQPIFDELIPLISKAPLSDCVNTLVPLYDAETLKFFKFIEENFQNKSSNSSLTNIAIARYGEYKRNINSYLIQLAPQGNSGDNTNYASELASISVCRDISQAYIDNARAMMIKNIKTTSSEKKATIMVEKYKSINDQLRSLNFNMAQMYSYFATFKNKLPGYLGNECITR